LSTQFNSGSKRTKVIAFQLLFILNWSLHDESHKFILPAKIIFSLENNLIELSSFNVDGGCALSDNFIVDLVDLSNEQVKHDYRNQEVV
jgi:hypothetical protein